MWISVFSAPVFKETVPCLFYFVGTLVKDYLTIYMWNCFGSLYSSIDLHTSLMPVFYCFNYYSLVIKFKITNVMTPTLLSFLKFALAISDLLGFHVHLNGVFYCYKKCHWDVDKDYTESADHFEKCVHFNVTNYSNLWALTVLVFIYLL